MDGAFRQHLEAAVGADIARRVLAALEEAAPVSIRLHPEKLAEAPFEDARSISWSPWGRFLPERPAFTLDPLLHAGAYYVQDSSAMFVGEVCREMVPLLLPRLTLPDRPLRVLDACAAPGGKTTDLAASLRALCGERFFLVANEVMRQRAGVLRDNVARWGDPAVAVTAVDPAAFACLEGFFDLVLADVPCSGEGMFRKDPEAVAAWSEETVRLCQARQRRILADLWDALAEGGILVYSTCTFNRLENDDNVRWAAETLGAEVLPIAADHPGLFRTETGISLLPGLVRGEGQFVAALRKTAPAAPYRLRRGTSRQSRERRFAHLLRIPAVMRQRGGTLAAVPEAVAAEADAVGVLRPLALGLSVGTLKGETLVPSADLALSPALVRGAFPRLPVSRETALHFLHRDSVAFPSAPKGYLLLTYQDIPIGFVKNLGSRCNNLHPQGRRIWMDI